MTATTRTLTYQIAEEYLVLHTTSLTGLCPTLERYTPFRHAPLDHHQRPLLEVWDDHTLSANETDEMLEEVLDQGFRSRVYRQTSGDYRIEIGYRRTRVSGLLSRDLNELRLTSSLADEVCSALSDRLIMIAFSLASGAIGCLKVHASVIEQSGKALLLMGVSGTGKSTHSRLWLQYISNCSLINDDEPIIRLSPSGQVRVYGCPWSGSTPCYRNVSAEVKAFVQLKQAPYNALHRLSGRESFTALYSSCATLSSLPHTISNTLDNVLNILSQTPVYHLDNLPNYAAVQLTHALLTSNDETNR